MKWHTMPLGEFQANCYIIYNEKKEALIIDPGAEAKKIIRYIEKKELKPLAILLTHAHLDHIGALENTRSYFQVPVYIHINEADWLEDPKKNGSSSFPFIPPIVCKKADRIIQFERTLIIGDFIMEVFETPGHSPGSVSYYFKDHNVAFTGDALFRESIGRTDLYGGNYTTLLRSIREKLFVLPNETICLSGHGDATTIEHEKQYNPFLGK